MCSLKESRCPEKALNDFLSEKEAVSQGNLDPSDLGSEHQRLPTPERRSNQAMCLLVRTHAILVELASEMEHEGDLAANLETMRGQRNKLNCTMTVQLANFRL